MKFLIFGDDDESLPFFRDEEGIVIGNNEIVTIGSANDKWLERGRISRFANGLECHVMKMPERRWSGNPDLSEGC